MSQSKHICLYCQTPNYLSEVNTSEGNCSHCGMPLSKNAPGNNNKRQSFFKKAFWLILLFCLLMIIYLPR